MLGGRLERQSIGSGTKSLWSIQAISNLDETGELAERAAAAWEILRSCTICPQNCRCNRIAGKTGVCRSGTEAIVASWNVHRREEPPISGTRGAGQFLWLLPGPLHVLPELFVSQADWDTA